MRRGAHRQFSTFSHMRKKSRHADAAPLRCCWPHPQTQSQKRVNKKTWRKKLHTHALTHIDCAPPPPLLLFACCAAANHRICLRIARQKQHNENVDSSARKKEKKKSASLILCNFCHTHTLKHTQHQMAVAAPACALSLSHSPSLALFHHVLRSLRFSLAVALSHA